MIHIDDGHEWRGGQHQVFLLVTGLASRGVAQRVLTPRDSPLAQRLRTLGEVLVEYDGGLVPALVALASEFRPGILHAHRASAHRDALRVHRKLRRTLGAPSAPALLSTRRVDFAIKRNPFSRSKYRDPHQHYIAISRGVRDVLVRGGVHPELVDVVHSGVPPLDPASIVPRDVMRTQLGLEADEIAVGNVGALTDHKGQRFLLEAAPKVLIPFPMVRFLIFGEGELQRDLETLIHRLGLQGRARLLGHVPDARHKLGGLDVYAHPSHLEGLGTSILDAMLAGLPVVAASAGGITDVIKDGETGLLAPPRDAGAFARRLLDLLRMSPGERAALAERGRAYAATAFSADAMVEGTLAVYRKIVSSTA